MYLFKNKKIKYSLFLFIFMLFIVFIYSVNANIKADTLNYAKKEKDLTIYDSNSGFYEVPSSLDTIIYSNETKVKNYPVMKITDTLILKDNSSNFLGLSVYNLENNQAVIHAEVGKGNESTYDLKSLGISDFVIIKTQDPFECSELTLNECENVSGYINKKYFSVTLDGLYSDLNINNQVSTTSSSTDLVKIETENDIQIPEKEVLFVENVADSLIVNNEITENINKEDENSLVYDTTNSADSTLTLSETQDKTPEISLESIYANTSSLDVAPLQEPLSVPVINTDTSNNNEIINAEF